MASDVPFALFVIVGSARPRGIRTKLATAVRSTRTAVIARTSAGRISGLRKRRGPPPVVWRKPLFLTYIRDGRPLSRMILSATAVSARLRGNCVASARGRFGECVLASLAHPGGGGSGAEGQPRRASREAEGSVHSRFGLAHRPLDHDNIRAHIALSRGRIADGRDERRDCDGRGQRTIAVLGGGRGRRAPSRPARRRLRGKRRLLYPLRGREHLGPFGAPGSSRHVL